MRIAAQALDLEIAISGVQRVADRRRWRRRPWKPSMRAFHASQARRSAFFVPPLPILRLPEPTRRKCFPVTW